MNITGSFQLSSKQQLVDFVVFTKHLFPNTTPLDILSNGGLGGQWPEEFYTEACGKLTAIWNNPHSLLSKKKATNGAKHE